MDFSTIRNKLNRFEYNSFDEIVTDVRLIFANCATYNLPNSIVAVAGKQLEQFFERRLRQMKFGSDKRNSVGGVDQAMKPMRAGNRKRTL
jgi:Bromodomain